MLRNEGEKIGKITNERQGEEQQQQQKRNEWETREIYNYSDQVTSRGQRKEEMIRLCIGKRRYDKTIEKQSEKG